jgi:hypothetical protein
MKSLLNTIIELFQTNEDFQRKLMYYQKAMRSDEWAFMRDVILTVKGQMAADMFSQSHTRLGADEKDVIQRTYYNINNILTFLQEPEKWLKRKNKFNLSNLMPGKQKASR